MDENDAVTAWEIEHRVDPRDDCDSFVLLDGGEARAPETTYFICGGPWPDDCDHEAAPAGYRMSRPFAARFRGHETRIRETER